ncbi:uncharacterized protein LOC101241768 [Hydra vulgaris]|uniref:uncharacterized protein LOC101241768 n=1 Tax=Hydra vulgaris TaxID=6087 RepID=UPI0002B47EB0|nr:uncharacterized protein LOC101241768 [Hydra vulgaris]
MSFFAILILMISIELFKTQGPRFGVKEDNVKVVKTNAKHFDECSKCANDKSKLFIHAGLKEYHNLNLKNCNISDSNLSEWCVQRINVMLNKADSVCKIYPEECECIKSCYRIK